jgi:hypothetical protein
MIQGTLRRSARCALAAVVVLVACDDAPQPVEICGNHLDDDHNLLTDCEDPPCRGSPSCEPDADADVDADADDEADADVDPDADADVDADPDVDPDLDPDGEVQGVRCDLATGVTVYESPIHDGAACIPTDPIWSQLYWEVVTPAGTSVELGVRTAEREADLEAAVEVPVAVAPPDRSPADLAGALVAAGQENGLRFLQVVVRLRCAGATAPSILVEDSVLFFCE